jgi:hypothetical protein
MCQSTVTVKIKVMDMKRGLKNLFLSPNPMRCEAHEAIGGFPVINHTGCSVIVAAHIYPLYVFASGE